MGKLISLIHSFIHSVSPGWLPGKAGAGLWWTCLHSTYTAAGLYAVTCDLPSVPLQRVSLSPPHVLSPNPACFPGLGTFCPRKRSMERNNPTQGQIFVGCFKSDRPSSCSTHSPEGILAPQSQSEAGTQSEEQERGRVPASPHPGGVRLGFL